MPKTQTAPKKKTLFEDLSFCKEELVMMIEQNEEEMFTLNKLFADADQRDPLAAKHDKDGRLCMALQSVTGALADYLTALDRDLKERKAKERREKKAELAKKVVYAAYGEVRVVRGPHAGTVGTYDDDEDQYTAYVIHLNGEPGTRLAIRRSWLRVNDMPHLPTERAHR